ncbi:PSMD3 isoform 2 [Pongo abelii]|uniref:PSMD3 isoform 2 n=1 Tax=Pongo abelii TaxID=9601 RepID=A0A2J8WA50_PONAB|nr:PSMD3 isoform 2 [Pongo abelii]
MKQEGSARRRGADKAKPPPGGGEQEPPPPPAPQDVEMKEETSCSPSWKSPWTQRLIYSSVPAQEKLHRHRFCLKWKPISSSSWSSS